MEPVKTCGNCWWGPSKFTKAPCKIPTPFWVRELYIDRIVSDDTDATDCPCWRERWVEGR